MKHLYISLIICFGMMTNVSFALTDNTDAENDSTGLPGDQFSLEGALELFKNSASPEDFEKRLNTESNNVNNLDLDGDNETDYIQVTDKTEGNAHALVLSVSINEKETQDVAVIEIEKNGDESAVAQILGDEELYGDGDNRIVEPYAEKEMQKSGKGGPWSPEINMAVVVVNVWAWAPVRFIFAPIYKPWVSPWYWHHYPGWWKPWRPLGWGVYHRRMAPFRAYHHHVVTHRVVVAHRVYAPHRRTSVVVRTRYAPAHMHHQQVRGRKAGPGPAKGGPRPGRGPGPKGGGRGRR